MTLAVFASILVVPPIDDVVLFARDSLYSCCPLICSTSSSVQVFQQSYLEVEVEEPMVVAFACAIYAPAPGVGMSQCSQLNVYGSFSLVVLLEDQNSLYLYDSCSRRQMEHLACWVVSNCHQY